MFSPERLRKFSEQIAIRFYETAGSVEKYRYEEIVEDSILIKEHLEKLFLRDSNSVFCCIPTIAVQLPCHSPILLPAIIGIINSNASVCFLQPNITSTKISSQLRMFKTNIVLVDQYNFEKHQFLQWSEYRQKIDLTILGRKCVLLELHSHEIISRYVPTDGNEATSSKVFYCTTTSGTTSDRPKVIGVTYKCFLPNVLTLSKIYKITQNDAIFVSAPPTFDPFMLDVCLALHNGASLIMTANAIRLSPKLLLQFLFDPGNGTTILQTTPSLFTRWSDKEIKEIVLSTKSSLRMLALGGEPFPAIEKIRLWQNWNSTRRKHVFNLYGLTEISCWCSVHEVTNDDITSNNEIPLGRPMDELVGFGVKSSESGEKVTKGIGELYIQSKTRKCFLDDVDDAIVQNDDAVLSLKTGDVVEIDEAGNVFYRYRSDSIIKQYGRKVNLNDTEWTTKLNSDVTDACCVFDQSRNKVLLFVIKNSQTMKHWSDIEKALRQALNNKNQDTPDVIVAVKEFPLSMHGKVSKRTLFANYENSQRQETSNESISDYFTQAVNKSLDFNSILSVSYLKTHSKTRLQKKQKSVWESSFVSLGGDSLKALNLTKELETRSRCSLPNLLTLLLNERVSIGDVFSYVNKNTVESRPFCDIKQNLLRSKDVFKIKWSIDMEKCIDATPTVCILGDSNAVISVGSHSGILNNVSPENGEIISKLVLPDRIESQVTQYQNHGIVGCYDGFLYSFDIRSGKLEWQFDSGGMIKCRPLCAGERIVFGNYASINNLWCLNAEDGTLLWSIRIGTKSIYSDPVQFDDEYVIICTLDGTITKVNISTGEQPWSLAFNSPIFSSCAVYPAHDERYIIFATVDGTVNCLNGSGFEIWSEKVDGNIFSSFEIVEQCASQSRSFINFLFGSHNCFLYSLRFDLSEKSISEEWKLKMSSKLTSTPKLIRINGGKFIVSCMTNGLISLNRLEDGVLRGQIQLPGDIFSTPAILNDKLFVGCRNNLLYCLEIK